MRFRECSYTKKMCTKKLRALSYSYIGAKKITFPPKPDIQTGIHTYRQAEGHQRLQSSFASKKYKREGEKERDKQIDRKRDR